MPLVTAVCPTGFRPLYLRRAIACFLSQTFTDSELLILDDGKQDSYHVVPLHPRIRYEYGQPGTWAKLGDKRNAINEMADGEIIWHLDDDDWSAPERMGEQVEELMHTGARAVGYNSMLFYRPSDGGTFKYTFSGGGHYAVGTSLCYWHEYWKNNRFPSMRVGEDSQFALKAASKNELISKPGWGKMVARTLGNSTAKPNLGDSNFPVVLPSEFPEAFWKEQQLCPV